MDLSKVNAAVAEEYEMAAAKLQEAWQRDCAEARAVAVYLARKLTGLSGKEIAEAFGVSAVRVSQLVGQVEKGEDPKVRRRVERLRERLLALAKV